MQEYATSAGITLKPKYEGENISSAMSLVASSGGVTLVPIYAQNMLPPNVVAGAFEGIPPKVDLVLGYAEANPSPLLRRLMTRANDLIVSELFNVRALVGWPERLVLEEQAGPPVLPELREGRAVGFPRFQPETTRSPAPPPR